MTSTSKLYFSDNFSPGEAKHYTLLIQIRNTDFSFAVVHQNALLVWGNSYPVNELISPGLLREHLDKTGYQQVIIGITPLAFNLVPKALYNADKAAEFIQLLDVKPAEKAYSQTLDEENQVLFKDADDILPMLTAKYINCKVAFGYKGWLQAIGATSPPATSLYLDVQEDEVHFAYFKNNKLRFYNSFKYNTPDELVYFTALTATELQLTATDTRLIVSGDVAPGDKNLAGLSEFFPKIDVNQQQQLQQLIDGAAPQYLLSLTALVLCA